MLGQKGSRLPKRSLLFVFHRHQGNSSKRRTDAEHGDAGHYEHHQGVFGSSAEINESDEAERGDVGQDKCEPKAQRNSHHGMAGNPQQYRG